MFRTGAMALREVGGTTPRRSNASRPRSRRCLAVARLRGQVVVDGAGMAVAITVAGARRSGGRGLGAVDRAGGGLAIDRMGVAVAISRPRRLVAIDRARRHVAIGRLLV